MKKPFKKVIANKNYKLTLGRKQTEKMTIVTNLINETPKAFIKNATMKVVTNGLAVEKSRQD